MSELNSDEKVAKTVMPPSAKNQHYGQQSLNTFEKKIIAVAGQKKKKEIIQIQDSDEDRQGMANQDVPKDKSSSNERARQLKKYKKNTLKCNLCKSSGKKSEMRMCLECRSSFHIACLQQEREATSRYICQKCRFNKQEEVRQAQMKKKLQRKTMTIQLQKMSQKKIQKERRKVQISKKVAAFSQRYPYYFVEDRIRFPIEDKLLFIYRQLFQFNENNRITPTQHPLIPSHMLGDLLQIENFFSTFKSELQNYTDLIADLRKSILYVVMNSQGYDFAFSSMLFCLIKIYLADIFDKNKTDNVKILNEHCFFTILNILNENEDLTQEFVIMAAEQIFRYLGTIPSMKKAFDNFKFPQRFNLQTKTGLIVHLIKGLSQVDEFHGLVSIKSQKMQQFTKEKGELITQLKKDEAQSLCNNERLKEISFAQKQMQQNTEGVTRQISKQIQKQRKKMQKLAHQQSKSQQMIKEIKGKIAEIGRAMPFLTSQIIFLGLDRNNSQYFFYCNEPNRLYVKYHNYLLDDSQDFLLIQGKESIIQLVKSLNNKGTHQRHLIDNITSLIKDQIITNVDSSNEISQDYCDQILSIQSKYTDITRDVVVKLIKEAEETFATYLTIRNFQWASPTVREVFMENLKSLENVQEIKECIKTLQEYFLFVEHASNGIDVENRQNYQESDDQMNKTPERDNFVAKKKIPIRIWGINSEKIKKYWIEYLEECIDIKGLWICAYVFKNNVDKYVKKKMESIYEQQQKEERISKANKEKEKEKLQKRKLRSKKQDRSEERSRSRDREYRDRDREYRDRQYRDRQYKDRSREQVKQKKSENNSQEEQEDKAAFTKRPNLRQRKKKKKMNIDSDLSAESQEQNERKQAYQPQPIDISDKQNSESDNEDACAMCQGYGDMICCDTCPKVYHVDCLGIKQVPQGEWSCFKCLQKLTNQRQTRSRMKKLNRYPQ